MPAIKLGRISIAVILTVAAISMFGQDGLVSAHTGGSFVNKQVERLKLQHRLDYDAPLYNATFIGSHNSFSSLHEGFSSNLNHHADMRDQLNKGARVLNYDLHAKGTGKLRRVAEIS